MNCEICKKEIGSDGGYKNVYGSNTHFICGWGCLDRARTERCRLCGTDSDLIIEEKSGYAICPLCVASEDLQLKSKLQILKDAFETPANICAACGQEFTDFTQVYKQFGFFLCTACDDVARTL